MEAAGSSPVAPANSSNRRRICLSKRQRPNYFGFSLIHRTPTKATNKPTCRSRAGALPRSDRLSFVQIGTEGTGVSDDMWAGDRGSYGPKWALVLDEPVQKHGS